jgi:hypothetical protein
MKVLNGNRLGAIEYFHTTGEGYQSFADVTWHGVPIDSSYDIHKLVIGFTDDNINLCSVHIEWNDDPKTRNFIPRSQDPTTHQGEVPPITWSAFEYDYAYDTSPDSFQGNCHEYYKDDGVDGVYTSVSSARKSNIFLRETQTNLLQYPFDCVLLQDEICIDRDGSHCNIAWTRKHGRFNML